MDILKEIATGWPTFLASVLLLAVGYVYAYRRYDPVIRNLKQQVTQLQWQLHDLKNERNALKTKLELTQVSDTAQPAASGTTSGRIS